MSAGAEEFNTALASAIGRSAALRPLHRWTLHARLGIVRGGANAGTEAA